MKPIVSVVLPVYNSEKYIEEAINSILKQTFVDFELIVVDDKSTDNTVEIIKRIIDPRITLYINEVNIGRAGSDNFALSKVQGKYIAKMDGDDICHPERLNSQVAFLENNPQINVIGTWMQCFGNSSYLHKYPLKHAEIACRTLLGMPMGNSSLMLRSELFFQNGMQYNSLLRQSEDYAFFAEYFDCLSMYVIPRTLQYYRTYPKTIKKAIINDRKKQASYIRRRFLVEHKFELSEEEYALLDLAYNLDEPSEAYNLKELAKLYEKLIKINKISRVFDHNSFLNYLSLCWFYACYHNPRKNIKNLYEYYTSSLSQNSSVSIVLQIKLFYKSLFGF